MIKIISALALLGAITVGGAFVYYGTLDPCRMLAHEMARDTLAPVAEIFGQDPAEVPEGVERSMRMITSQYSANTCVRKLWGYWVDTDAEGAGMDINEAP